MQSASININESQIYLVHRIKQINVLKTNCSSQTLLIVVLNLYNRSSVISFYQKNHKILSNFIPLCEIIKVRLTNLKICEAYLEERKSCSFLIILTPFSIVLYHIFLMKKIREIRSENIINSHKYSFDDFSVLYQSKSNDSNDYFSNNSTTNKPFYILTSSNDCFVKIWDIVSGKLFFNFSTVNMNKHFLPLIQEKFILSIYCGKIFNQTKSEINIWNWRKGNLQKNIRLGSDIRSILQIENFYTEDRRNLLIYGAVESTCNYKIHIFDWENENIVKKIDNLCSFNFFYWGKNEKYNKENSCIMLFNKNMITNWNFSGLKQKTLIECEEDYYNFTTGAIKNGRKIIVGKGLKIYSIKT